MYLSHRHGRVEILLIGQHDKDGLLQLFLLNARQITSMTPIEKAANYLQHGNQLCLGNTDTIFVARVDNIYYCIGIGVITTPVWPDASLTTEIPNLKFKIFIRYLLYVESNRCKENSIRELKQSKIITTSSNQANVLGMVVTTSPTWSRYRMVVFPAPSRPRINILISRDPSRDLK